MRPRRPPIGWRKINSAVSGEVAGCRGNTGSSRCKWASFFTQCCSSRWKGHRWQGIGQQTQHQTALDKPLRHNARMPCSATPPARVHPSQRPILPLQAANSLLTGRARPAPDEPLLPLLASCQTTAVGSGLLLNLSSRVAPAAMQGPARSQTLSSPAQISLLQTMHDITGILLLHMPARANLSASPPCSAPLHIRFLLIDLASVLLVCACFVCYPIVMVGCAPS